MFDDEYREMITIEDLCEMLSIGKNTAYSLLKSGKISGAFKIGRIWKIPREAVSQYILKESHLDSYFK